MNVLEIVNTKIIEKLKSGINPWRKPWNKAFGGYAQNIATAKHYHGINMFLLEASNYITFKQLQEIGGKLKKGSKSEIVVFSKKIEKAPTVQADPNTGEIEEIDNDYFYLKYYNVFKAEDIENFDEIKDKIKDKKAIEDVMANQTLIKLSESESRLIETVDNIIKNYCERYGLKINSLLGDRAFYNASNDSVTLPLSSQFKNIADYYSTIFHELGHSTGYLTRLNRLSKTSFGTQKYSKEELIAEITAVLCLNYLGIDSSETNANSAAYLKTWADNLDRKKNTWFILSATNEAEKAFKMICGIDDLETA